MKNVSIASLVIILSIACFTGSAAAADAKDPLSKYSDENLIDIGFCFQEFCKCIAAKDAKTAAAFIADMPRGLAQLNLDKEADKASFLKFFAGFDGASVISSQRMAIGGIGEVKYTNKAGKELTQRMQNMGGRWKLAGL